MIENVENVIGVSGVASDPQAWLIMFEAICLSVIGGVFFVILKDVYGKAAAKHLVLAAIIGFWVWSILGEPNAGTLLPYGIAGACAPEVGRHLLKNRWWKI